MTPSKSPTKFLGHASQAGFTLVELLVGMVILGIIMAAFTQIFGSSLRASSEVNARNDLVSEGQIAQQLIASRLQNAVYVYPIGTTLNLTATGATTKNTVGPSTGQNWKVGTDPFIAFLTPPVAMGQCPTTSATSAIKERDQAFCYTFYAYYPYLRSTFTTDSGTKSSAPDPDSNNASVWVLMEYRANIYDGINRTTDQLFDPPITPSDFDAYIKSKSGTMLTDFIQPTSATPTYTMFTQNDASHFIDIDLRQLKIQGGKTLRVPAGNAPFASPTPTLSTRVYPRNWF